MVQDEADEFAMKEDEEPRELYRRVTKLAVSLWDHGSKDTDDNWIKRNFLKAMMPYHKAMSSITHRKSIMDKLNIRSVSGLTIYAVMNGYVEVDEIWLFVFASKKW